MEQTKINFWELSRAGLAEALENLAIPPEQIAMRVSQLWRGVYVKGERDFSAITTLSKDMRTLMNDHFSLARLDIANHQASSDGTQKWLLNLSDGGKVEMVFIPEEKREGRAHGRGTLCISSQIGCTLTCRFCRTGTQAWQRNVTAGEIVGQAVLAFDHLKAWGLDCRPITNIVFMGQGEPLLNLDNVIQAIKVFNDPDGFAFSRRKITVSTAGYLAGDALERLGKETGVRLALSLHASDDKKRTALVPLNKKYDIASLLSAVRDYTKLVRERITFEYVLLNGINDGEEDAKKLVQLIKGIPAKVNLIPFNPWQGAAVEGVELKPSSAKKERAFASILLRAGYPAPVRRARGQDIMAACGQLKTESQTRKRVANGEAK